MAKIPFDIKYRPQIESGEYKVETANGYPVTIYRWDFKDKEGTPIMGSYIFEDGTEYCAGWSNKGCFSLLGESDNLDLFIITPEPELTNWEKHISGCLQKHGLLDCGAADKIAKECSTELLDLARKELVEEFEDKERNAFYNGLKNGEERAKAEALKDLPRWRKCGEETLRTYGDEHFEYRDGVAYIVMKKHEILLSDLEKLPGFKED